MTNNKNISPNTSKYWLTRLGLEKALMIACLFPIIFGCNSGKSAAKEKPKDIGSKIVPHEGSVVSPSAVPQPYVRPSSPPPPTPQPIVREISETEEDLPVVFVEEIAKTEEPSIIYGTYDLQKTPSYPGGDIEMQKFIDNNLKYPAIARENGIQGTVVIQFVVGIDGILTNITVMKEPGGGGLAKEAQRIVSLIPKWSPGEANGKPVICKTIIPVRFRL